MYYSGYLRTSQEGRGKRRRVRNKPTLALFALLPPVLFNASRAVYNNFIIHFYDTSSTTSALFATFVQKKEIKGNIGEKGCIFLFSPTSKQSGWSLCDAPRPLSSWLPPCASIHLREERREEKDLRGRISAPILGVDVHSTLLNLGLALD